MPSLDPAYFDSVIGAFADLAFERPAKGETLECGGKRKRDTAFGGRMQGMAHLGPPAIPSEGGVALTLPAALQGCQPCSQRTVWAHGAT